MEYQRDHVGPLHGVRVLDLTRLVAGNQLTLLLADFGAEVIKVEQAGRGDPLRDWRVRGESTHWKVYARNKKSITLDLKQAPAREILLQLAERAQVLVENFKPGTLEAMGIGPDVLHGRNPRLVVVRVSGWGQTGPYAERPGFGTLVEAMSGFAALNGFADREPVLPPLSLADMVAGLYGAAGTLIALREVEVNGGQGQVIDLPLFDPLFSILGPQAANFRLTGELHERSGSRSHTASPRNVYRTKDGGWLALSASTQVMTERLFRVIGREDLIDDPRFRTNADRLRHGEELDAIIGEQLAQRSLMENFHALQKAGVAVAPVYAIDEILEDPHVKERQIVVELPDDNPTGSIAMHTVVPRLLDTPGAISTPAPALGEHNREILGGLGITEDDLRQLAASGTI